MRPVRTAWVYRVAPFLLPVVLSGCVQQGISAKSADVHRLFYVILWLALPVFVFVEGMLVLALVRYRRRRGDDVPPPQTEGARGGVLTAFFAGPLVIVVALLAYGEHTAATVDRNEPHPSVRVVVTGIQWAWSARYVGEGFSVTGKTLGNRMEMELPVGETARLTLESRDVLHEFYVPHLLYMKNAVPGHPNVITVTPTKVGAYPGQCAQYCGLWHAQMRFLLRVVPRAQYAAWIHRRKEATARTGTCAPTGSAIALTAHQISWDRTCVGVDPGRPFRVTIRNEDAGIAHNFAIWDSAHMKRRLYLTPNVTGPATKTFTAPALKRGTYYFQCDIHGPAMAGTLVVGRK